MNYLETGLPHTDFVRRKTDFSPPRFIPLCSLGRKYRGLESLTKREMCVLVKRLSEPKRSSEVEDPTPDLTLVRRKATPGTGRFVGQKKMSSFEIDKMVDRLYSRRATKDYAFVDETVEADDIVNMTNRNDVSSDSENEAEENKIVKDRENSLLRGENSVKLNAERARKHSALIRRENTTTNESKSSSFKSRRLPEAKEVTTMPSLNSNSKPKTSVSFHRAKSLTESKKHIDEHHPVSDSGSNECSFSYRPEFKRSQSSLGQRSQPFLSQRSQASANPRPQSSAGPTLSKSDVFKKPEQIEERRKSIVFATFIKPPLSYVPELSRPSTSNLLLSLDAHDAVTSSREKEVNKSLDKDCDTPKSPVPKKLDSPRQKSSKADANKPPRFAVTQCDELLIDRVATYNRSKKLRCK
ncbi:uncharacterized protein LOC123527576 [Mercenaria mercenaria]|uniref:uncharacterized protein LOC123527576 n=1 Tax=Mercenaria mercenaria TaxID=6596 RepID=UPI001E1D5C8A|nr:uncharacterized protein LOC123527576 [Mercenaria mercenaria]